MEIKKQTSWFKTDVGFENSFKFWFALNWKNKNIQVFPIGFTLLILQFCYFDTLMGWVAEAWYDDKFGGIMGIMGMLLPIAMTFVVVYKGFYQHFNDLKHGRRR